MVSRFLPGVPGREIENIFNSAAGNEISSRKFDSPESSAALAANSFGFCLKRPPHLSPLPSCEDEIWHASRIDLESTIRFQWRGGRLPVLDCVVAMPPCIDRYRIRSPLKLEN